MIHISRNSRDEHGRRIRPPRTWFTSARAATRSALREQQAHVPDRSIYGHNEVRASLEKLFHDKCAYCESRHTPCSDWDVEHYRPKGRVAECKSHPGYYWLTYVWENLYPVCSHCNQRRKDKPRWKEPTTGPAAGKLDQFPLLRERTRAMRPSQDVRRESTLLIDPSYDNPEDYLGYDLQGQIFAIDRNLYGAKTIEICHLRRRRLRDARKTIIEATIDIVKTIRKAKEKGDAAAARDYERLLRKHFTGDGCLYAAAARAVRRDPEAFGI